MHDWRRAAATVTGALVAMSGALASAGPSAVPSPRAPGSSAVERLRPVGGLPAHMCGQFRQPTAFVQSAAGRYFILDRRNHTVFSVDKAQSTLTALVRAGREQGAVLQPGALSLSNDGTFAVSDAPFSQERIQLFFEDGTPFTAFLLPGVAAPRLTVGPLILNGTGSMQLSGQSILINAPESGALVSELNLEGQVVRHIGTLRATGHEDDRPLHLALNVGIPLRTHDGGAIVVFQTGVPLFRKYAADGRLEFERHIEGPEVDGHIQTLPTTWPVRKIGDGTFPLVAPIVRAAALSPGGDLWVSLVPPVTYVYDAAGEKTRTVQFDATGAFSPTSLSFSRASGTLRLLALPGCYEFAASATERERP